MKQLIIRTYPIEKQKINCLSQLIHSDKLFISSFEYVDKREIFDTSFYLKSRDILNTDFYVLLDRNVITRLLSLYNGKSVKNENDRLAAGILAFLQLAEITIEPNIALYEAAMAHGNKKANQELHQFRKLDNLHPKYWAAIALKEVDELTTVISNDSDQSHLTDVNFEMPLRRWRRLYVLVLKLAHIELQGGNSYKRMSDLLEWMYKDYMMPATPIILAAHYLAPNNNRKGLLKNLRSSNRELALKGIKNATWDLFLIEEWVTKIKDQDEKNQKWILCSLDYKLRTFAKSLIFLQNDEDPLESTILTLFGTVIGDKLIRKLREYRSNLDSPERMVNQKDGHKSISCMINRGEEIIRNWSPQF
ncbi:hypothetical protein ACXWTF_04800 [Thiomicrolovo sp. ZZH C-3]